MPAAAPTPQPSQTVPNFTVLGIKMTPTKYSEVRLLYRSKPVFRSESQKNGERTNQRSRQSVSDWATFARTPLSANLVFASLACDKHLWRANCSICRHQIYATTDSNIGGMIKTISVIFMHPKICHPSIHVSIILRQCSRNNVYFEWSWGCFIIRYSLHQMEEE